MQAFAEQAIARVNALIEKANELYGLEIPKPTVSFDIKGYRIAGYAKRMAGHYYVMLNREACEKYPEFIMNDTIPHEVAHLVCFYNPSLGKNHDAGWQRVCKDLGGSGSRTHELKLTPARNLRVWQYRDTHGKIRQVTTVRHNKIQKKGMKYRFSDNGGIISAASLINPNSTKKVNDMDNTQETTAQKKQDRYRKSSGRPSKAYVTRQIIMEMSDASKSEIFTAIQERVGFTRAMARHYYYANLKVLQKQQEQQEQH